ncbi:lipoprotein [Yersinia enterocolitica]
MKNKILVAAALFASLSLSGCGDKGIYGEYVNEQYGVRLDIQKDVIKFKDGVFNVKSWDESQKPVYIARTQNVDLGSWTFKFEKVKQGVVYQGVIFKKD